MSRKILIVDDNAINREMLGHALRDDYEILHAAGGGEALDVLARRSGEVSAVLLDVFMPDMDGYEVLRRMRRDAATAQIPVIIVTGTGDETSRLRALDLGANDFVVKPCNPEILRHCLRNNIALRETASIVNAIQRDRLTGLYNREFFFEKAGELISAHPPETFVLSCFDINNFKLVNDQYGVAEGDRILRHVGEEMVRELDASQSVCGRISGDNFAWLFPNRPEIIDRVATCRDTRFIPGDTSAKLRFSVGYCVAYDPALPVSALYDRAYIAKQSIKGRYDQRVAWFDESMLRALVHEQEVVGEMTRALAEHEFEAWFQPQYNHATGATIGAEALARWRHPVRGLVPPYTFIPIFEKNGFIYELDKYIWEEVCRYLRKWIDEGGDPMPVSVNLSRYDVFRADVADVLTGLLQKYNLPIDMLRLEVTESAFSESSAQIITAVERFVSLGFTVEIDDFGNGYSSLNTLKDVPAQVIKLDMRFLESSGDSQRGAHIIESVVRMARQLGMAVIAEGVEDLSQADYLLSIGCTYMQGYLYAKPMPALEYEQMTRRAMKEPTMTAYVPDDGARRQDRPGCWCEADDIAAELLDNLPYGAGLFGYTERRLSILCLNRCYWTLTERDPETFDRADPMAAVHPDDQPMILRAIDEAIARDGDASVDARLFCGRSGYRSFRVDIKIVRKGDEDYALYVSLRPRPSDRSGKPDAHAISQTGVAARLRQRAVAREEENARRALPRAFLIATFAFCALVLTLFGYMAVAHPENNYNAFSESVMTISEGWTLTDSAGVSRSITLPLTIPYGTDGRYTISGTLPAIDSVIAAPVLRLYSNYVDLDVDLDGERLLSYPETTPAFSGATGNTYHYVRLPVDYARKTLTASLRCQLGDDITYLLSPPLFGSKATMLHDDVLASLPSILLAGCLLVLAALLAVLRMSFKNSLLLSDGTTYTVIFSMIFACYVFCETVFAQTILTNGYLVSTIALVLLALMPIPLTGLFAEYLNVRFRAVPGALMILCFVNLAVQAILNLTAIGSYRAMLPATHAVLIAVIVVMGLCMLLSGSKEKPGARRKLFSALPMILGGIADIALLAVEKPSFNNSFWFTTGVTAFIVVQFCGFVRGYFTLYRESLENKMFRDMAYTDALANIGNRNAYERKLDALGADVPPSGLGCIVMDINDLKRINDTYGHQAGDQAIMEIGDMVKAMPVKHATGFRTGGDEFVVLLDDCDEAGVRALAEHFIAEADRRSKLLGIPIVIAVGFGRYAPEDGDAISFIQRVDAMMYANKQALKNRADYPFSQVFD